MTASLWMIPAAAGSVVGCLGSPALAQRFSSAWVVSTALVLIALGLAVLATFSGRAPVGVMVTGLVLLDLGVAIVVTLGTDLIVSAAPLQKAGAAAAISETAAELGGSFGVTILGSIGAGVYRAALTVPRQVDSDLAGAARETLGGGLDVASGLPPQIGAQLSSAARAAFAEGFAAATGMGFVILAAMAAVFTKAMVGSTAPQRRTRRDDSMNNLDSAIAIQHIIDWTDAICQGDMDRVLLHRTPDIVMFDVPQPVQEKGIDAYRATWNLFFAHNPPGPDRFRVSELNVVAGVDVAFARGLLTIGGGQAHCRLTLGFRKHGADWRVHHEHHSMPIDVA